MTGNVTLPSISVNGNPVDLTSQQTKDDLNNKTSQLYIDLVNLAQPEVNFLKGYYMIPLFSIALGSTILEKRGVNAH